MTVKVVYEVSKVSIVDAETGEEIWDMKYNDVQAHWKKIDCWIPVGKFNWHGNIWTQQRYKIIKMTVEQRENLQDRWEAKDGVRPSFGDPHS